jgi:hypothetical protein
MLPLPEQLLKEELTTLFDISGIKLLALLQLHKHIHICVQPLHVKYSSETFLTRATWLRMQ